MKDYTNDEVNYTLKRQSNRKYQHSRIIYCECKL